MCLGLFCKHTLCFVSMSLAFSVLLVRVLHRDLLVHHVLAVHAGDSGIGRFEVAIGNETVSLGHVVVIARDLWRIDQWSELAEGVIQRLLVHHLVEVANEQLCANLDVLLLICGCLVHSYAVAVKLDVVHDFRRVICLLFCVELDKSETLVLAVDAIHGHVDIAHAASIKHKLVQYTRSYALMEVTHIDGGFLVLFPVTGAGSRHYGRNPDATEGEIH